MNGSSSSVGTPRQKRHHLRAVPHRGEGLQQRVHLHGGEQFRVLLEERVEVGAQGRVILQRGLQAGVVGHARGVQPRLQCRRESERCRWIWGHGRSWVV
jgi:hypothetical protein